METIKISNSERQKAWQKSKRDNGLCVSCGSEPLVSKNFCIKCLEKCRNRNRARTGCKPWVKGNRGRPPIQPNFNADTPKNSETVETVAQKTE